MVCPVEALVGLSRIITWAGRPPPLTLKLSISVSKLTPSLFVIATVTVAGAVTWLKVEPPSMDTIMSR